MNTLKISTLLSAALLVTSLPAMAEGEIETITAKVNALVGPRQTVSEVKLSPMEGVYEIALSGRTMYATSNGSYLLLGDVYDTDRKVSLGEEKKQEQAIKIVNDMPEEEMIVFAPEKTKRSMTVFTDVDCGYCRKLHKEVPQLVDAGVEVRYLWFPRAGIGSESYDKAVSVWCADDQQQAMNDAKNNNKVVDKTCENPVAAQYEAGQKVGVRGTPTLVLDDGTIIGGYLPKEKLLTRLGIDSGS